MEKRNFGSTKRAVPVIGQGTWNMDDVDRDIAIRALRAGLDLGMTHIDTAEMYGTEQLVGEAIAGRRNEVFVVSKVLPEHASRTGTIAACEKSLKRLTTDRLDCYLLHWRGRFALADTFAAFEQLVGDGKILSWGVSNFDVSDLEEAWNIAPHFACNQVLYNIAERAAEHAVLPWCEKHGVAVVAYSPFGHGRFPSERTKGGRVLHEIAAAHKATPRQIALAFLLRNKSVFAIPKASNPDHAAENAAAGDLRLTASEIERIDEAFPRGRDPKELPTL
jgi:diketogulonate reductase-like aldo/keto reductase